MWKIYTNKWKEHFRISQECECLQNVQTVHTIEREDRCSHVGGPHARHWCINMQKKLSFDTSFEKRIFHCFDGVLNGLSEKRVASSSIFLFYWHYERYRPIYQSVLVAFTCTPLRNWHSDTYALRKHNFMWFVCFSCLYNWRSLKLVIVKTTFHVCNLFLHFLDTSKPFYFRL